ncbi:neuronal acetylcholine receptor subunit beta-3-like [Saccostrea echinata]|uniref:neuronal acetylcholine receptor subunit beta-3-like n=1 Tax=Saccostrea echinata TaxID=191078 RepID=UPI002A823289|nr:neuronal acetylcholine receptor subunit beta-3-like [Saccostrea echinata]
MNFLVNIVIAITAMCALTSSSRHGLRKDILTDYSKELRPDDNPITVNLKFTAFRLINYDDKDGKFTLSGILELSWLDGRIAKKWESSLNNDDHDINMYFLDTEVWTPRILQMNPHSRYELEQMFQNSVMFDKSGLALMMKMDIFTSDCNADFSFFPYDTQTCSIDVAAWGFFNEEIVFTPNRSKVNMDHFEINNFWKVKDTRISVSSIKKEGTSPIPLARIEFIIKRRAAFFVLFLILPILFMEILQLFVFMLPWDCGERSSYSVTVLLAIAVYLTIVTQQIPESSGPTLSILAMKMVMDLSIACMVQIFVIISHVNYNLRNRSYKELSRGFFPRLLIWAKYKDLGCDLEKGFFAFTILVILFSNIIFLARLNQDP